MRLVHPGTTAEYADFISTLINSTNSSIKSDAKDFNLNFADNINGWMHVDETFAFNSTHDAWCTSGTVLPDDFYSSPSVKVPDCLYEYIYYILESVKPRKLASTPYTSPTVMSNVNYFACV